MKRRQACNLLGIKPLCFLASFWELSLFLFPLSSSASYSQSIPCNGYASSYGFAFDHSLFLLSSSHSSFQMNQPPFLLFPTPWLSMTNPKFRTSKPIPFFSMLFSVKNSAAMKTCLLMKTPSTGKLWEKTSLFSLSIWWKTTHFRRIPSFTLWFQKKSKPMFVMLLWLPMTI